MPTKRGLEMKLSKMGLSAQARNSWAERIALKRGLAIEKDFHWPQYAKRAKEFANQFTVGDLVQHIQELAMHSEVGVDLGALWKPDRKVVKRLVELGFTQIDCIVLPNSTVETGRLKRLGRKKILECSVLLLGTLSSQALSYVACRHRGKSLRQITIGDLLKTDLISDSWYADHRFENAMRVSFLKTREKLHDLGFRYEDGIFLQHATRRQLIENLMDEEEVTRSMATRIVAIAEKRKWEKGFVE